MDRARRSRGIRSGGGCRPPRILERRAADYRRLVDELLARGYTARVTDPEATAAALSFLLSPEGYQQLVAQSGWSTERYAAWVRAAILAELTR